MSDVLLDSNVLLRLLAPTDPKHVVAADAVADAIGAGHRLWRAHDARLAAPMHVHGIRHVLTFNLDDFKNLPDVVAIEPGVPIPE